MNVLLVGLGYVGKPLGEKLARLGHRVVGLRKSEQPRPSGVSVIHGDATDPNTLSALDSDFDQLVVLLSAGERGEAAYERTYVGGAKTLRAAFPRARLLWVSSTGVYADDAGEIVTDETTPRAPSGTGAVLLRAESVVKTGPHLIVRPSGIYGPERTTLLERLARGGIGPDEREVWTNRIHRDDLVRLLTLCIERPTLAGTLLASDPEPAQLGAMQDWVQAELALHFPPSEAGAGADDGPAMGSDEEGVSPLPPSVARTDRAERAARAARAARVSRAARAAAERKSRRIQPTRLTDLGFEWRYPSYRDGYAPLLADLGPTGSRS